MLKHLKALCALDGVSGNEDAVRDYLYEVCAPHADSIRTDALGNLIVFKKGKDPSPFMLAAHMDEVGFIITSVTSDGFLKFASVGGFDRRVILGKRVRINGSIPGYIGLGAIHLAHDRENAPALDSLCIDIGAKSRDEALKYVKPGDYAAFDTEPEEFGENLFKAKAIDDRVGCAVMAGIIEDELPLKRDTYFVFTVCEEVGGRGAAAVSNAIRPDSAAVLEGTTAADIDGAVGPKRVCELTKGVVINLMDNGTIYDRKMFSELSDLADSNGVSHQIKQIVAGGTDAGKIHVAASGIPCAGLAAPVRYIHAPASVVSLDDVEGMDRLTRLWIGL